jgi:hypothetical protein
VSVTNLRSKWNAAAMRERKRHTSNSDKSLLQMTHRSQIQTQFAEKKESALAKIAESSERKLVY